MLAVACRIQPRPSKIETCGVSTASTWLGPLAWMSAGAWKGTQSCERLASVAVGCGTRGNVEWAAFLCVASCPVSNSNNNKKKLRKFLGFAFSFSASIRSLSSVECGSR